MNFTLFDDAAPEPPKLEAVAEATPESTQNTDAPTLTVSNALDALEAIAPAHLKMGDDPSGLLVGDVNAPLGGGVVVALDVTLNVIEQAKAQKAGLIVSHHPLIYNPAKTILAQNHPGREVWECAKAGISVACAHTNWDVADGGVNDVLATLCGLTDTAPLQTTYTETLVKLAVFVPSENREQVFEAMTQAGAGHIGKYDRCGFWTSGTGTFRALSGANPHIGNVGMPENVSEERIEVILPKAKLSKVLQAMQNAHPYEEVAYDVYALVNDGTSFGVGRVGTLAKPTTLSDFVRGVQTALQFEAVRWVGDSNRVLRQVAVCGGAGAFMMSDAIRAGADAYVTSDVRHDQFVAAQARGFCLIDAGHKQTETPGTHELATRLQAALPDVRVTFIPT